MAAAKTHPKSSIVDGMKRCTRCAARKPVTEFTELKAHPGSYTSQCKRCCAMAAARRRRECPEKARAALRRLHLRREYGITPEIFDEMLVAQAAGCAICGSKEPGGRGRRFHVDHDHETKRVRGLLCHFCNTGLGSFKDDADLLRLAAQYLTRGGG